MYAHNFVKTVQGFTMQIKNLTLAIVSLSLLLSGCDPVSQILNADKKSSTSTQKNVPQNSANPSQESAPVTNNTGNTPLKQINILAIVDSSDAGTNNGSTRTKIDHFIAVSNQVFQNSIVPAKLHLVGVKSHHFMSSSSKGALSEVYHNKSIAAARKSVGADIVMIYRNNVNDGLCGTAYFNKGLNANIAYAHVSLSCPSTTTAHEIGHTMGLAHSERATSKQGRYAYGHGYGIDGAFATIMSYTSTYNTNIRLFNYSSPSLECQGYTCGSDNANAAQALNNSIGTVANFR